MSSTLFCLLTCLFYFCYLSGFCYVAQAGWNLILLPQLPSDELADSQAYTTLLSPCSAFPHALELFTGHMTTDPRNWNLRQGSGTSLSLQVLGLHMPTRPDSGFI